MTEGKKFTTSDVIDRLGVNGFTWVMFFFLGFAMIFDGYDYMIVNTTNALVANTFFPGVASPGALMGSLTTWSLLGMVIGGAIGGMMSDRFGRKFTLTLCIFWYGLFTLPQAFSVNYAMFAAFRLIAGIGVGSCIPVVTTCFSETMPTKNRGVFVTFGMAFMVFGWVLAGVIGNPIQQHTLSPIIAGMCEPIKVFTKATGQWTDSFANWRVAYLIGAVPIIYAILLFFFMKETPAWYVSRGRVDEAVKRLEALEQQHGLGDKLVAADLVIPPKPAKQSPSTLFNRKYLVGTAAIWVLYSIGQFCVYGMNTWLPSWFKGIGYTATQAVTLQTWNNVAAIVSNVTVGFISDIVGRRRNMIFSWVLAAVLILICALFVSGPLSGGFLLGAGNNFALCIVLMLLFGFALNYSITAVQPLMPEIYPTSIRNMGVSWCQAFARFAGASSSIVLGAISTLPVFCDATGNTLPSAWNTIVLFLIIPFAIAFIASILFVQKETAGKSMDDLQTEMEEGQVA